MAGSIAEIIGNFKKQTNIAGGEYFQRLDAGILIVLSFDVVPHVNK